MNRIDAKFEALREAGQAAFIPYIVCGDPDLETTEQIVLGLAEAGADIIEFGVPFSDPVADGVANQEGALRALTNGTSIADCIALAGKIRTKSEVPILLFTYYNPVFVYGTEKFVKTCVEAGIDGVLCVDLPVEEADDYIAAMRAANLSTVFLIAPTSSPERAETIAKVCTGFIYYVSRTGVTGEQAAVEHSVHGMVDRIKAVTPVPVAVGFGISKPEHASEVAAYADGVVVGSHIVRKIGELGKGPDTARTIVEFVKPLIDATKAATRATAG